MQITIDTSLPLNDLERAILSMCVGGAPTQAPSVYVEPTEPVEEVKSVAKKAAAKKAAATPEPMAEEPLVEEELEEEEADEHTDEELLALAVKKATEMVAGGEAAKVREALDAAGASRVRELNKDNVRDFFRALS